MRLVGNIMNAHRWQHRSLRIFYVTVAVLLELKLKSSLQSHSRMRFTL